MKRITTSELISVLLNVKGSNFVSIETITQPKLKANNPFGGLTKISSISGVVNFIYENSVNNQRLKEGKENNFKSLERKWGQKIQGTPLIVNRDKYYLEIKVAKSDSKYIIGESEVAYDRIKPYLYERKTRQELENEIILRDYSLDSIKKISVQGQVYTL